ncbi:hypothetical protein [Accumulibacter sp.]|uniref:hypothetical protein n=1 Tax=Accumulibacter sp. TaxID=2053492 RepID=UPI0025910AAB|nr:hypothetical protein [Accumulibacter sp.]
MDAHTLAVMAEAAEQPFLLVNPQAARPRRAVREADADFAAGAQQRLLRTQEEAVFALSFEKVALTPRQATAWGLDDKERSKNNLRKFIAGLGKRWDSIDQLSQIVFETFLRVAGSVVSMMPALRSTMRC